MTRSLLMNYKNSQNGEASCSPSCQLIAILHWLVWEAGGVKGLWQCEGAGLTEVGLPRRTTLTPFSCKPCRMLSVAALVSAQASTAPTPCSPPVSTFTMRLRICSRASSVLVFPVPGGPCKYSELITALECPLKALQLQVAQRRS